MNEKCKDVLKFVKTDRIYVEGYKCIGKDTHFKVYIDAPDHDLYDFWAYYEKSPTKLG